MTIRRGFQRILFIGLMVFLASLTSSSYAQFGGGGQGGLPGRDIGHAHRLASYLGVHQQSNQIVTRFSLAQLIELHRISGKFHERGQSLPEIRGRSVPSDFKTSSGPRRTQSEA